MNTPILFQGNKEQWKSTPTTFGWDQMILLEDLPGRLVILSRDFGRDDVYMPYKNEQYIVFESKGDIETFHEEISNGNYNCDGIYDIATDQSAGDDKRFKEEE